MEISKIQPLNWKDDDKFLQPYVDEANRRIQLLGLNMPMDVQIYFMPSVTVYYKKIVHPIDLKFLFNIIMSNPLYIHFIRVNLKEKYLNLTFTKNHDDASIFMYEIKPKMIEEYIYMIQKPIPIPLNRESMMLVAEIVYLITNTIDQNLIFKVLITTPEVLSVKISKIDHEFDVTKLSSYINMCSIQIYLDDGSIVITTFPKTKSISQKDLEEVESGIKKRKK
jgi:hypothetical protein